MRTETLITGDFSKPTKGTFGRRTMHPELSMPSADTGFMYEVQRGDKDRRFLIAGA